MSPRLRFAAALGVLVLVIAVVVNLALGNGLLPGLGIGLIAAALSIGVEWLLTRRREAPPNGG